LSWKNRWMRSRHSSSRIPPTTPKR
jgi:hypothetical protein